MPPVPGGVGDRWRDRLSRHFGRRVPPSGSTAFVLSGGGSRGAVQVGMLGELVDRGIRADRVYGASVGAVNAAAYSGDPTPAGIVELERVWRSLSGAIVFPRRRSEGPWTYFQQRPAVHANTGLRRILEDGVRFDRVEDAAVPLEVVATSLADGRECWLTDGPVVEAVLASAAIPAMFPPVTIGGELLIDGGVVNNVPISRAIEQGARTVYVLLCGPLHYRPRAARRPVEAVLTAFFVAVQARFARELAALPPGVEVVVFSGGGDPTADYRDFSSTAGLIEAGRAEVARVLDGTGSDAPHAPVPTHAPAPTHAVPVTAAGPGAPAGAAMPDGPLPDGPLPDGVGPEVAGPGSAGSGGAGSGGAGSGGAPVGAGGAGPEGAGTGIAGPGGAPVGPGSPGTAPADGGPPGSASPGEGRRRGQRAAERLSRPAGGIGGQ